MNSSVADRVKLVELSIIIPLLNEEGSLHLLYDELERIVSGITEEYEILFIDDGSTDGSYQNLLQLRDKNDRIKIIKFRRNFGKAAALSTGFAKANGKIIITMDADLQDDPKEIPNFLKKLNEGNDLVSGWKEKRYDPLSKTLPSKIFNKTISLLTGLELHDFNCGFKAYRNIVAKNIKIYGELHRYIPALAHSKGFKVAEIPVQHHPREYGKSKYGIERFTRGFFDCMTVVFLSKYDKRPLHLFGKLGLLSTGIGFLICLYLTAIKISGEEIGHRPLLNLGVLLIIIGVQFYSTGLLAEMITNNSHKTSHDVQVEEEIW